MKMSKLVVWGSSVIVCSSCILDWLAISGIAGAILATIFLYLYTRKGVGEASYYNTTHFAYIITTKEGCVNYISLVSSDSGSNSPQPGCMPGHSSQIYLLRIAQILLTTLPPYNKQEGLT